MIRELIFAATLLGFATSLAHAQSKPPLTVYTYGSFAGKYGPGKTVKERFEADCACELNWVTAEDAGSLVGRLRLEGQSTKADVVVGLDMNLAAEAKALGLFAPHDMDVKNLSLPIQWADDTFVPFDWGHLAFVYDSNKLANPPKSLKELVENPNGPKIVLQDPRTSAPGLGFMLWMRKIYGDQAGAAWTQLKPRVVTFTKGWSEAYGLFTKGEADMVMSYTTSPAYHVVAEKKNNFKAANFAEGHYLHVELAGMTRTTKQPELAKKFMAFILSDAFQSAMPEGNWMMPAKDPASGLPAAFNDLVKPAKTLLYTPEEVQQNRRTFTDEWLNATSR
ncbi:thiamine ABC transporter substrate binding subunit [Microvirga brassicacearum]|uniref:Thiamine ABC transporter substrate binding subunit n=1 Tax=Microvirga brassicacearum TaxID=2580413 RepID=A0A5N3PCA8_9HYPH|nr:thiamine ABC transporter substrate binding subunit [Microvirga brassicacearum]KAB0267334.1 thiamine ABC transporter substrate binding subunit [Microvirga brassicacearum]